MDFIPLSSRVVTPLSGSSWTALCSPFSSSRTRFWRSLTPRLGRVSSSGMASSLRAALRDPFLIWFTFLLWAQGQTLAYLPHCRFCVLRPPVPKCPCARSKPEVIGKLVASYVAVLVLASFGMHTTWHRLYVHRPTRFPCPPAQFIAVGDSNQKYLAKSLCLSLLCWFWRHAAFIPPGKDSAFSGHPFPSKKVGFAARTQGACSQRRCGESLRAKFQRVSSEDRRTPIRGQAVKQSAEMRSALVFFATAQSCRWRASVLSLCQSTSWGALKHGSQGT